MTAPESKTCALCGESKPLEDYYRDRRNQDGRAWRCKACMKAKRKTYPSTAERKERYGVRAAEVWARYYAANGDAVRARWRAWAKDNPERRREARGREAMERAWRKRRAIEAQAFVENVDFDYIVMRDQGVCGICREPVMEETAELDHIVPLAVGGMHERNNVQLAHRSCNRRKWANLDGQIHMPV